MHLGRMNNLTEYYMNGVKLESVTEDLGIIISHDLKVSSQCTQAYNKARIWTGRFFVGLDRYRFFWRTDVGAYRTLRHQEASAPRHFGTIAKWCRTVSGHFGTSAEVSRPKCLGTLRQQCRKPYDILAPRLPSVDIYVSVSLVSVHIGLSYNDVSERHYETTEEQDPSSWQLSWQTCIGMTNYRIVLHRNDRIIPD